MRGQPIVARAPLWARNSPSQRQGWDNLVATAALLALAATILAGAASVVVFIFAALSLFALRPGESARTLFRFTPLLLIAIMALVSTIWSDAPQRTARAAIQLFLTMMAAVLVCRRIEGRQLVLTLFLAFFAISLTALPFLGRDLAHGGGWKGLFESKNQLGMNLHLVFALGLAVLADRSQAAWARWFALAVIPLSVVALPLTQSGTAMTSAGVTLLLFPLLLLFGRIPISGRIALAILGVIVVGVALALLPQILDAIGDFRQNVLKKDATLTGRTYLWEYAARLTAERPLLGHGYYAFWRQGNLDAEGLWRWGGIASRGGFNFHNAFVEMKVDMGYLGQALLIASCAFLALAALYRQLTQPSVIIAFFASLQIVLYLRSFSETGLIAPFSLLTVLWVASGVYALSDRQGSHPTRHKPRRQLSRRERYVRDPARR